MAIQQSTVGATSGNLTQFTKKYMDGVKSMRLYDQFASPVGDAFEPNGSTKTVFWYAPLQPRPTAALGNEVTDFDPQTFRDTSTTIAKNYYNDGLKMHDLVSIKSSLNPEMVAARLVGELAMNTFEHVAIRAITEGSVVLYGDDSVSARSSLDLGTAGHRLTTANFARVRSILGTWETDDNALFAVIDNWQYEDLLTTSGSAILNRAGYTEEGKKIIYNYEVGMLAGIKLVVAAQAKTFYGAGAANASAVNTTVATSTTANIAGSRTVEVAANTNIVAGMWLTVGTLQTAGESDATILTEIVRVAATPGSTTVTITGTGAGGGLRYDHAVGATVKNADTVHCAMFGHSSSAGVDFQKYGRYGQLVTPFQDGNAKQWTTWAFKGYTGYQILDQSQIVRIETSAGGQ